MLDKTRSEGPARASTDDVARTLGLDPDGKSAPRRGGRALVLVALLALAAGGGWYGWTSLGAGKQTAWVTEPARRGDLTVLVTATGTAQPITQVNISSELSGTVRKVFVDYNSPTKAGQVLAELDTEKLQATVASLKARVAAARAGVVEAEATIEERRGQLERKKALAGKDVGTVQDLDAAKAAYDRAVAQRDSAKAEVAVAEADLKVAEINLAKACICAPIDGVVLKRSVDPGQIVASSLQAPVLFVIAQDLRQLELQIDVDEADVGKVKVGQSASFAVDAYPDRRFPATIRDIRYGSETIQGVVTYKVVLAIDNADLLIRPGMTATADIVVDQVRDALLVPNTALRFTPPAAEPRQQSRSFMQMLMPRPQRATSGTNASAPKGERGVWVLRDGAATKVPVRIGATDGRRSAVVDGPLQADEAVIVDVATAKP